MADDPRLLDLVAILFREYVESLDFPLTFQDFERELADLASEYGPPTGRALVAMVEERPAGAVGVRRFDDSSCEIKRMYVRPEFRGLGIGFALAESAIAAGADLGYQRVLLDTIRTMESAVKIYRSLGFVEIGAYRHNPLADALYMAFPIGPTSNPEG